MLDRGILVVLAVALAYLAFDKFVLDPVRDAELQESARQAGRSEAIIASIGDRSSIPEIAERLNVTYVLDGSVRKAGGVP